MDISQRRYDTGGGNTGTTTIMVHNTFLNNTLAALELDLFIDITTLLHTWTRVVVLLSTAARETSPHIMTHIGLLFTHWWQWGRHLNITTLEQRILLFDYYHSSTGTTRLRHHTLRHLNITNHDTWSTDTIWLLLLVDGNNKNATLHITTFEHHESRQLNNGYYLIATARWRWQGWCNIMIFWHTTIEQQDSIIWLLIHCWRWQVGCSIMTFEHHDTWTTDTIWCHNLSTATSNTLCTPGCIFIAYRSLMATSSMQHYDHWNTMILWLLWPARCLSSINPSQRIQPWHGG